MDTLKRALESELDGLFCVIQMEDTSYELSEIINEVKKIIPQDKLGSFS